MNLWKMEARNKRRGRLIQNIPRRRAHKRGVKNLDYPPSVNIQSSWFIHGYKTCGKEINMNIREMLKRTDETIRRSIETNKKAHESIRGAGVTIKNFSLSSNEKPENLVEREELVRSWSRLFESQGMPHDEAEKQARLTVAQDGKGNLLESLKRAGFTDAQAKFFIEGRGGADNLTEISK